MKRCALLIAATVLLGGCGSSTGLHLEHGGQTVATTTPSPPPPTTGPWSTTAKTHPCASSSDLTVPDRRCVSATAPVDGSIRSTLLPAATHTEWGSAATRYGVADADNAKAAPGRPVAVLTGISDPSRCGPPAHTAAHIVWSPSQTIAG